MVIVLITILVESIIGTAMISPVVDQHLGGDFIFESLPEVISGSLGSRDIQLHSSDFTVQSSEKAYPEEKEKKETALPKKKSDPKTDKKNIQEKTPASTKPVVQKKEPERSQQDKGQEDNKKQDSQESKNLDEIKPIAAEFYEKCQHIFKTYVDKDGLVDYSTLRRKRIELIDTVKELKTLHPAELLSWSKEEKIAFWINTHNIITLKLIIDSYPIKPRWYMINYPDSSIMQIPGGRTKVFFRIMGLEYTLTEIEKEILLNRFSDPRICFALSYASLSSAPLRNEAYTAANLDKLAMPTLGPVVKWLLIINVAVFVVTFMIRPFGEWCYKWFSVLPVSLGVSLQLWRYITYQFLHDLGGMGHIFGNMLGLYFFGPVMERTFGSRRFLFFYLMCGAAGGLLYPFLVWVHFLGPGYMVGASGALFGILAACAIYYPHTVVLVMFVFPMKLWILASLYGLYSFLTVYSKGHNAGGEAAHLAGMAVGAAYVLYRPLMEKLRLKRNSKRFEQNIKNKRYFEAEVDRVLNKVHSKGVRSLTRNEKKILQKATELEQRGLR